MTMGSDAPRACDAAQESHGASRPIITDVSAPGDTLLPRRLLIGVDCPPVVGERGGRRAMRLVAAMTLILFIALGYSWGIGERQ